MRKNVIEIVLGTDMTHHAKNLNQLKTLLKLNEVNYGHNLNKLVSNENITRNYENQQFVLRMILHSADISNPCKPTHIQKMWVDLLMLELFNQGDLEKQNNLALSVLCDRERTNINKAQIGFINFIVYPTFETISLMVPEIDRYLKAAKVNLARYEEFLREEEEAK